MSVRIRLARGGSKKRPVHKIVVADKRSPRDGRFIESIGFYNPLLPQDHADALRINVELAKKWMGQGAELTDRVEKLFARAGLVDAPAIPNNPKQAAPKAKAQERLKELAEKAAAAEEAKRAEAEAAEQAKRDAIEAEKAAKEAAAAEAAAEVAPAETAEETVAE